MAISDKVDSEFFVREIVFGWAAVSEEFGKNPEELARLQKCVERKGELFFEHLQLTLKIPPGDPLTVAKAIGDYLRKVGYASGAEYRMVSDTEMMSEVSDLPVPGITTEARKIGLIPEPSVLPAPSCWLVVAALKKLCNIKATKIPVPDHLKSGYSTFTEYREFSDPKQAPPKIHQEMWRLSPLS